MDHIRENQARIKNQIFKSLGGQELDLEKAKDDEPVGTKKEIGGVMMEKQKDGKWDKVKEEDSKKGAKGEPQDRPQ